MFDCGKKIPMWHDRASQRAGRKGCGTGGESSVVLSGDVDQVDVDLRRGSKGRGECAPPRSSQNAFFVMPNLREPSTCDQPRQQVPPGGKSTLNLVHHEDPRLAQIKSRQSPSFQKTSILPSELPSEQSHARQSPRFKKTSILPNELPSELPTLLKSRVNCTVKGTSLLGSTFSDCGGKPFAEEVSRRALVRDPNKQVFAEEVSRRGLVRNPNKQSQE